MRSNIFDICYEKSICINKHVCMILIYIYIYSRQQDMSTYTLGPQTKKYNEMLYILSWFAIPLWSDIYIYIIYICMNVNITQTSISSVFLPSCLTPGDCPPPHLSNWLNSCHKKRLRKENNTHWHPRKQFYKLTKTTSTTAYMKWTNPSGIQVDDCPPSPGTLSTFPQTSSRVVFFGINVLMTCRTSSG